MTTRPMGETTAEITAVAEATREEPATPDPAGADLVLVAAARLRDLAQALDDVAALAARWERHAEDVAAAAAPWLFGARSHGWADALDAAVHELRATIRFAARPGPGETVETFPRPSAKAAAIDAVHEVLRKHNERDPAVRSRSASRLPFETAQAAISVVAPAAHDAALQRARGLLLDHGHREAAALLRSLEQVGKQ